MSTLFSITVSLRYYRHLKPRCLILLQKALLCELKFSLMRHIADDKRVSVHQC